MDNMELELLLARMAIQVSTLEFGSLLREYESLEQWADGEDDKRQHQREAALAHQRQRHAFNNDIKATVLAEFDAGDWPSRNAAARELAAKYGFSEHTVRRWLRKRPLGASN